MKNIDEAILHCEEIANQCDNYNDNEWNCGFNIEFPDY